MLTLFQAESLEFYCKGLASKKKFLANMKDEILDFSFTYFNLSRCQMPPAHSNV